MSQQQSQDDTPQSGFVEWPNLFKESIAMTFGSIAIFAIADLRGLARNNKLAVGSDEVFDLPITGRRILELLNQNSDAMKSARKKSSDTAAIVNRYLSSSLEEFERTSAERRLDSLTVHFVGDENASSECVYTITVSEEMRRICLFFRGSITVKDWVQDSKLVMGTIPNPVYALDSKDQPQSCGIHLGFRDYLYGKESSPHPILPLPKSQHTLKESSDDKTKSKLETILDQIRSLREKHPGYRLYVAGHSLGGALAVISSVEAAAIFGGDPDPVSCITIGNPKAGNCEFQSAVHWLERNKKLRIIGIHNRMDLVPMLPEARAYLAREKNFCHVGMKMNLYKETFDVEHQGRESSSSSWISGGLKNLFPGFAGKSPDLTSFFKERVNKHNYREYLERIVAQREELSKVHLNDIYNKEVEAGMYPE